MNAKKSDMYILSILTIGLSLITGFVMLRTSNAMFIEELTPKGAMLPLWEDLVNKLPIWSAELSLFISSIIFIAVWILKKKKMFSQILFGGAVGSMIVWNLLFCLSKPALLYLAFLDAGECSLGAISGSRAAGMMIVSLIQIGIILAVSVSALSFGVMRLTLAVRSK